MASVPPAGAAEGNPIEPVIATLTAIIDRSAAQASRIGYFAALYRRVTRAVLAGLGGFDDPLRMARFDALFAHRYLDALAAWEAGGRPSSSWRVAFQAAADPQPIVLQHLLLGMNAHINLDLGIAAARIAPGAALPGLHADFLRINVILGSLVNTVATELSQVSPLIGLVDELMGRDADHIANFSMEAARDWAWHVAETLAPLPLPLQEAKIFLLDRLVAGFGMHLYHPDPVLDAVYKVVRSRETDSVPEVIAVLAAS
jgi:uncharacterized protein DUF5995